MNDSQIFQMLGLTFFAIGVGMFTNPKFVKEIIEELRRSAADRFYGGLASLFIGFWLIAAHNNWVLGRTLIITLLGWMSLAKGLMIIMFPKFSLDSYKDTYKLGSVINYSVLIFGIIMFCLGIF